MTYSIPVNEWVPGDAWRPNDYNGFSFRINMKFIFYHIRPIDRVAMVAESGSGFTNEIQILQSRQVSVVAGIVPGFFKCVTVSGDSLSPQERYAAYEYDSYYRLGQAKLWYLPLNALFVGPWEIFNGPNPIDITT